MNDDSQSAASTLPYLSAEHVGTGGEIKRHDDDFRVEELPLYPASGEGTHVYFAVEKRGLTTHEAIRRIAASLGKQTRDIGYAGLKDAHGITRQTFSVEHVDPEVVASLSTDRMKILSVTRHTNKLKLGHLSGNRFDILIRGTEDSPLAPDALDRARASLDVLTTRGMPNYFGPQRFGVRGDNAAVGLAVLHDDYDEAVALILGRARADDRPDIRRARELFDTGDFAAAEQAWPRGFGQQARICRTFARGNGDAHKAWRAVDHSLRKLYVSAFQSDLFNRVLTLRLTHMDRLDTGDIAWKHRNGASFLVEDAVVEQPRCDAFEISPTGPLFGRRMSQPQGEPAKIETAILATTSLQAEQIRVKDGTKLDGARRPLRVPLVDATLDDGHDDRGPFLRLMFSLPPGAYATCVTREICKV